MKSKTIITVLVVIIALPIVLYLGLDIYLRHENPVGYQNRKICSEIPKGTKFSELKDILGEPIHTYELKGEHWFAFNTVSIAAGPIAARILDNQVLELRCSEDGPSTWIINGK